MTPLSDKAILSMAGTIGGELLRELCSAQWDRQSQRAIDEVAAALGTNPGAYRKRNEDRLAVALVTARSGERFVAAIVCDGVGGSEMGDSAATLTVAAFLGGLSQVPKRSPVCEIITDLIRNMDDAVRNELRGRGTTTASMMIISRSGDLAVANIGDSRVFAWTPGSSYFTQVSVDDTLENELRSLAVKDPSALNIHGLRGSLSQAIGESERSSGDLKISIFDRQHFPHGIVLATDGSWKAAEDGFRAIIQHAPTALDATRRTLAFASWAGATDNVSLVAIQNLSDAVRFLDSEKTSCARVCAWFADVKFVVSEPMSSTMPGHQAGHRVDLPKSTQPPNHSRFEKKKSQSRRKRSAIEIAQGEELRLGAEKANSKIRIDTNPKIEISVKEDLPPP